MVNNKSVIIESVLSIQPLQNDALADDIIYFQVLEYDTTTSCNKREYSVTGVRSVIFEGRR